MIRITCPNCRSKLNAKDELVGQTRKCPKCAQPVLIVGQPAEPDDNGLDEPAAGQTVQRATEEHLPTVRLIERLDRECHYLICNKTQLMATWANNGNGWMLRVGSGFLSAKRGRENLPSEGDFKLVELQFAITPDGKQLTGLVTYQLASRWAMTVLDQGDDHIAEKVTGLAGLNRDQKNAVRQALKDQFMRPVWEKATEVLEYLANADVHSSRVG